MVALMSLERDVPDVEIVYKEDPHLHVCDYSMWNHLYYCLVSSILCHNHSKSASHSGIKKLVSLD